MPSSGSTIRGFYCETAARSIRFTLIVSKQQQTVFNRGSESDTLYLQIRKPLVHADESENRNAEEKVMFFYCLLRLVG